MNFKIFYSKRRTISITIIDENTVKINAPLNMNKGDILTFVKSKENWINKKINELKLQKEYFKEANLQDKLLFLGEFINFNGDKHAFLKEKAQNYLIKRVECLSNLYNFSYESVKIKEYKSKFGQCDVKGNITLNYKIMMMPTKAIDYVIIHELCHTKYFSHNKNFHSLLSSYFKDEKQIKKQLKYYGNLISGKI